MSTIKEAFDNLLDTIEKETISKLDGINEKIKEKRQAVLKQDLADLEAQKRSTAANNIRE